MPCLQHTPKHRESRSNPSTPSALDLSPKLITINANDPLSATLLCQLSALFIHVPTTPGDSQGVEVGGQHQVAGGRDVAIEVAADDKASEDDHVEWESGDEKEDHVEYHVREREVGDNVTSNNAARPRCKGLFMRLETIEEEREWSEEEVALEHYLEAYKPDSDSEDNYEKRTRLQKQKRVKKGYEPDSTSSAEEAEEASVKHLCQTGTKRAMKKTKMARPVQGLKGRKAKGKLRAINSGNESSDDDQVDRESGGEDLDGENGPYKPGPLSEEHKAEAEKIHQNYLDKIYNLARWSSKTPSMIFNHL
ncbi:hypothetical protein E1B28_006812 [Marasmius oreades]|uniref:Uncharacterized protein n=1 Tax=Marasmius oreades TaxID=181124 RepID=A0A9P7UWW8_9AGAR|nr:uncharacterized protein E1B28_006812 [Marasmius oreades]KAG7096139.1 hypothetical protein E1B28_006812 [Marasmius oreades]